MRYRWLALPLLLLSFFAAPAPAAVTELVPRVQYTASGGAGFAFSFPVWAKTDLVVYVGDTLQTVDSQYTVSFTEGAGGTVTFVTAPTSGATVTIRRELPQERTSDFSNTAAFRPQSLNAQLDKLTAQVQDLQEQIGRAAKQAPQSLVTGRTMPDPENGKAVGWSAGQLVNLAVAADGSWNGLADLANPAIGRGADLVANAKKLYNVKSYGARGDGSTNDQTDIAEAVAAAKTNRDAPLYFPDGTYAVTGVYVDFPCEIIFDRNAKLVPHSTMAAGAYLLTVDGTTADPGDLEEYCIRVSWSFIGLDGVDRANDVGGLKLARVLRSTMGPIVVENCARSAIDFDDVVKEVTFKNVRTYKCGTASATPAEDFPVLDLRNHRTSGPPNDTHNNIEFLSMNLIASYGSDIYVESEDGATAAGLFHPRNIFFNNFMIHGPLSPFYADLTTYEQQSRKQVVLGSCDRIVFRAGEFIFGPDAAAMIHIRTGQDTGYPTNRVVFEEVHIGDRYSGGNAVGMDIDKGVVSLNGVVFGQGFTGFNALESAAGSTVRWDFVGNVVSTGGISIADATTLIFRKQNLNFGAGTATNLTSLQGTDANPSLSLIASEAGGATQSTVLTASRLAATNKGRLFIPNTTVFTFQNDPSPPSTANLITDGVQAAIGAISGQFRSFNGTNWQYIPRSNNTTGGATSNCPGGTVAIEVNGTGYSVCKN